jgi:hypothetical protein
MPERCVGILALAGLALVGCSSGAPGEYAPLGGLAEVGAGESYGGERVAAEMAAMPMADAAAVAPQPAPGAAPRPSQPSQATDAVDTSGPLLVYTAQLVMSVYRVPEVKQSVLAVAQELGGHLTLETTDRITLRVPAPRFEEALDRIQALGDVLSRTVQAQDVGEEFRDLTTRIENLEAIRRRVEQLLADAHDVQAALQIEQHLERITLELERLKGRQRFLADRVALSTITVAFQERQVEDIARGVFQLPFDWIHAIGLTNLMRLR